MNPRTISRVSLVVVLLAFAAPRNAMAAPFTFTFGTTPASGALVAGPGELVGWGYTIVNEDPDHWLEFTALDADPFAHAAPGWPLSVFDFPILAPATTRTIGWAPGTVGLYEFAFASSAMPGFANTGVFTVTATWWDDDPVNGGVPVIDAASASAVYTVTAVEGTVVPEPTTLILVASGWLGAVARRARRRA